MNSGASPVWMSTLPASSWLAVTQVVQTLPWGGARIVFEGVQRQRALRANEQGGKNQCRQ